MGLFVQRTRERTLVRIENGVKCFHSEFFGLAYTVRKIVNIQACR